MRRSWRAGLILVPFACMIAQGHRAYAEPERDDPAAIYHVSVPIDGAVIAVTAAGSLVPYLLSSHLIHPSCPCSPSSVNAFDRGVIGNSSDAAGWLSDATVALAIAVPPLVDWLALRRSRPFLDDLVVFVESLSVNGALATLSKYAVQRPIPRVYSDASLADDPGNYRAFYSGHTSLVFAALSTTSVTLNARYGLTWQPWLATALLGGSVAVERVLGGFHFYTDVLVGAAAGLAVGTAVSVIHLRAHGLRLSAFRPAGGAGAGIDVGGTI